MFDQVAEFSNFVVPFQVKIFFKGRDNFLKVERYFQKFSCYQEVLLASLTKFIYIIEATTFASELYSFCGRFEASLLDLEVINLLV
jgi:hypothetical protein